MKCLLFIITLCSVGRFIDVQAEKDADSNLSGDDPVPEITEEDNNDSKGDENIHQGENDADSNLSGDDPVPEITEEDKNDSKGDESDWEQEIPSNPTDNDEKRQKQYAETLKRFLAEMKAGDNSDLMGQNQHIEQSDLYHDLGRRSIAQAPPELVLLVAKESALLRAGKDTDLGSDFDREKILRSGDYWNGVWKEEVNPKSAMRTASQKKKLGSIKAKINPGTEFYKVVSLMKKISPQLLYIINKKQL